MKEILIPLNFTTTPVLYDSKQSFSASDESSGVLTFTTTANVTGTVASLTLRNASDNANRQTILVERLDINSSPFSYTVVKPLPFGNYEGEITLKKGTQIVASAVFLFGVNSSLSASVLPKLVEAYSLDALVEEVETEVSNLKDAYTLTVSETVKGVNRTDSTVQASENVRYLNEATRKANELLRISQETARVVAEEGRVIEFGNLVDSAVIEQTVTQEVAEKYQEIEATQANRLLSAEQQLADTLNKSAITLTHMFADNTARDAYFVANPTELMEQLFIKVGTAYQQYIEGVWTGSVPIVSEQLSATNQPIVDTGNYFATDKTNDALQELGAHKASTSNPHGVTKAQVGLGNVDNTSDANKPVSTAGQTALNLKADKTTTDGINTRLTAEETATANNKISAVKGKTFVDVDARLEDVEFDTAMMGTNLVANGDFANGLNDSISYDATISALNGELTLLATAMHGNVRKTLNVVTGNKYYIKAMVKATSNLVNINIAGVYGSKSHTGSGVYETLSSIWTSITTATFNMRVQDIRVSGWDNVYVKYMLALDLTATFGKGNEPTAEQMDRLLTQFPNSWFNGTENLFLAKWALNELRRLDSEKANKVQEAWITPTLVNSWVAFDTRTAKYKKADYGRVYLKGVVKSGTIGATIFTLPTGYRPDEALIFGVITVNVNGTVVCTSGANASVSLNGVNFFV